MAAAFEFRNRFRFTPQNLNLKSIMRIYIYITMTRRNQFSTCKLNDFIKIKTNNISNRQAHSTPSSPKY